MTSEQSTLVSFVASIIVFVLNTIDFILFYLLFCLKGKNVLPRDLQGIGKKKKSVFVDTEAGDENQTKPLRHPDFANVKLEDAFFPNASVPKMLSDCITKYKDKPFLGTRKLVKIEQKNEKFLVYHYEEKIKWQTFGQVNERIENIGNGIVQLTKLNAGDCFAIIENTSQDWFMTAQALLRNDITIVTVYATLGDDALVVALNETKITALLTNENLLPKYQNLAPQIPTLKHIIIVSDMATPDDTNAKKLRASLPELNIVTLDEVEQLGAQQQSSKNQVVSKATRDSLAMIMYTSGTTGAPKGVMITHGNILSAVGGVGAGLDLDPHVDRVYIGYLPLAHIFEFAAEHYIASVGGRIGYGNPRTLTDRAAKPCGDFTAVSPTLFIGVPRVFDTIKKGIIDLMNDKVHTHAVIRWLFQVAYKCKREALLQQGRDTPLWNTLIFRKFKQNVGGRLALMVSGGAALNRDTQEFLRVCFNSAVCQGYGLTETCAGATIQAQTDAFTVGNIGGPVGCAEIKLVSVPDMNYFARDNQGEVCIRGPCVSSYGYYKQEKLSAEVFRENGWFYTGDIGRVNEDGSLSIVDRKKNLVKLDGGEYVALEKLETIFGNSSFVSPNGICVYGDSSRSFLVALVLLSPKPTIQWAQEQLGGTHYELNDIVNHKDLVKAVLTSFEQEGKRAKLNSFEMIKAVTLLADEWTSENDMLTPSMKLQRSKIAKRYEADISRMYGDK